MAKFFTTLVSENLISDWADTLDWLLDEDRFSERSGWDSNLIGRFMNTLKKELGVSEDNYQVGALKNLVFPKPITKNQQPHVVVMMGKGNSKGRDIVRHLRNGIAHGRTNCFRRNGVLWIEISDYGNDSSNSKFQQSAYILLPAEKFLKIHKIYLEVEKSKQNTRSKGKVNKAKKSA